MKCVLERIRVTISFFAVRSSPLLLYYSSSLTLRTANYASFAALPTTGFPMSQIKAGKMEWAEEIFHISLGKSSARHFTRLSIDRSAMCNRQRRCGGWGDVIMYLSSALTLDDMVE